MSGYQSAEDQQRLQIAAAIAASRIALSEVWHHYFESGGSADIFEIRAYLSGVLPLPVEECDLLAQAVNDIIDAQPSPPRAPYRQQDDDGMTQPSSGTSGFHRFRAWLWGGPT